MWLGILCGGIVTAFLMSFRVKYALITGIALVSILSWPRNTAVTYFPHGEDGDSRFEFFKQVVSFHPHPEDAQCLEWNVGQHGSQFALALFTFLYVDIIDATATLYSMVRFCGVVDPKDGDFPDPPLRTARMLLVSRSDRCSVVLRSLLLLKVVLDRRGRSHRAHCHGHGHLLPVLHLLRPHIRIHPPLGDGVHLGSGQYRFWSALDALFSR